MPLAGALNVAGFNTAPVLTSTKAWMLRLVPWVVIMILWYLRAVSTVNVWLSGASRVNTSHSCSQKLRISSCVFSTEGLEATKSAKSVIDGVVWYVIIVRHQ